MTQLLMSLANSYITSKIYNLFGFSGGRQEDPKPLELFSTDIDTELFEGKYFAQYKTEPFYEPYVLSYFKDFNMMGLHFQKVAEKLPNADRKYDPNVLINEYEKHYNRFKSDRPPKYASPLSFNSFNKTSLEALGLLKDRAEKSVHPNSKYLACIIKSFETFLRKIDKKNTDKSWMPVSKLSFDLVNYLYFVQEKYGFSTVPQIIKILEIMSAVEVNSQSMLMKKSLEHEKMNFDNRADFDVYFQAALAIEKISTNLMRDLESTFSNRYANDLPLVHICNRFQCLMFILYMAADLPHSIEQSTEIKIRNTFLANLTGSFIHVLLSYFDLKHSMVSMIYYITMAHSKNLELLQAAYSALGLATKALQSSIFAATNHHGFDETELIYPGDVYGLVKEHFYNPIIEYMCTLFLQITTDRRPFSENLALVSDLSRVFSTLLGRKTEQTNFMTDWWILQSKTLSSLFPRTSQYSSILLNHMSQALCKILKIIPLV
ncbi:uncharacterized protein VICG_00936 [Vittaforma corneae ATCC 50505]|uniref:Uncharacterized protein n=1 Tax=Vittaforma corneae (strain ATCC 50505) TaxID=993615 RepID=L2GP64_VITCO|nr:uncharacterized protein VICG_00936 [Vittaforma corneae ATCC 50505]ELA42087.1 hypothetical protein VICG_00936 [Vittaforma corneae ATCC 50505]